MASCDRSSGSSRLAPPEHAFCSRACRRSALVLVAENDAPLGEIIGRHLDGDAVAGKHADARLLHAAGGIGKRLVVIVEFHAKPRVRQHLDDDTVELDQAFLAHALAPDEKGRPKPPRSAVKLLSDWLPNSCLAADRSPRRS